MLDDGVQDLVSDWKPWLRAGEGSPRQSYRVLGVRVYL